MMTISDIFDALSASDRPYKKAVPVERALNILEGEVKDGALDRDLFALFVRRASSIAGWSSLTLTSGDQCVIE